MQILHGFHTAFLQKIPFVFSHVFWPALLTILQYPLADFRAPEIYWTYSPPASYGCLAQASAAGGWVRSSISCSLLRTAADRWWPLLARTVVRDTPPSPPLKLPVMHGSRVMFLICSAFLKYNKSIVAQGYTFTFQAV